MHCSVTLATGMCSWRYLKSVLRYKFLIWIPVIRTLYINMNKEVSARGYFSKPKAVGEQKSLRITALGNQHKCVEQIRRSQDRAS